MKREIREEILQILLMLMHKRSDIPIPKSVQKPRQTEPTPTPTAKPVRANYLEIQPEDLPGIKRLKKLAAIGSTELEQFEEERIMIFKADFQSNGDLKKRKTGV